MKQRRWDSWRPDLILTILGLLGLVLFLAFYDQAFPSAALDLTLSREQIAERATVYMCQRGYDLGAYQTALTFEEASAYIVGESGHHFDPELISVFRSAESLLRNYVARIVI